VHRCSEKREWGQKATEERVAAGWGASETCGMVAGIWIVVKKIIINCSDCSNDDDWFERKRGKPRRMKRLAGSDWIVMAVEICGKVRDLFGR